MMHYKKLYGEIIYSYNYDELVKSGNVPTRPKFTVWDISSKGYKGAHFAVYPEALIVEPSSKMNVLVSAEISLSVKCYVGQHTALYLPAL